MLSLLSWDGESRRRRVEIRMGWLVGALGYLPEPEVITLAMKDIRTVRYVDEIR